MVFGKVENTFLNTDIATRDTRRHYRYKDKHVDSTEIGVRLQHYDVTDIKNSQNDSDTLWNCMCLNLSDIKEKIVDNSCQSPHNYSEIVHFLYDDNKSNVDLEQFEVENLRKRFNSEEFDLILNDTTVSIHSKKDTKKYLDITQNKNGSYNIKTNFSGYYALKADKDGNVINYKKGQDEKNYTLYNMQQGQPRISNVVKNGYMVEEYIYCSKWGYYKDIFDKNGNLTETYTYYNDIEYSHQNCISYETEYCFIDNLKKELNSEKDFLGNPIAEDKLDEYINAIDSKFVFELLQDYKVEQNGLSFSSKNENSLIEDIMKNETLDIDTRIKYVKHIFSACLDYCRGRIYVDDIEEKFNKELEHQKKHTEDLGDFMLEPLIQRLRSRYLGSGCSEQKDNVQCNGKIDNKFKQLREGDCWLMATIRGLSLKPKGLEILNNMIKVDENGNVTVTLKGVKKTYTFTKQEVEAHTEYATGDLDVRAVEMAVNEYFYELRGVNGHADINGNAAHVAYEILVGKENMSGMEYNFTITDADIDNYNNENNISVVARTGHAYTVLKSDADYVYFSNPQIYNGIDSMEREEFKKVFYDTDGMNF